MKNSIIYKLLIVAAAFLFAFSLGSCSDDETTSAINHKAGVRTLIPVTDASGTAGKVIYEGGVMTTTGVSLENISKIFFGDIEVEPATMEFKTLTFKVPKLGKPQAIAPYRNEIKYYWGDEVVYTGYVYVTVPQVSAEMPDNATVGGIFTIKGGNLEAVNSVKMGDISIPKKDFITQNNGEITVKIPSGAYAPGENTLPVKIYSGDNNEELVVSDGLKIYTPAPVAPAAQSVPAEIDDQIEVTGEYLNLMDSVYLVTAQGEYKLLLTKEVDGTKVTVKIPREIEEVTPDPIITGNLVAYYGDPAVAVELVKDFKLDTTAPAAALPAPTMTSIIPEDGGTANDKFYLKKEVIITGTNLENVEKITVGGLEVVITEKESSKLVFSIPEDYTFTAAADQNVAVFYDNNTELSFGNVKVYPFYYWKDKTIGSQDVSNSDKVFFSPDTGEVVSSEDWLNSSWDSYVLGCVNSGTTFNAENLAAGGTTMVTANGPINKLVVDSEAGYRSVKPYFFMSTSSSSEITINGPANSVSQIRNLKTSANVSLITVSATGTPIVMFRTLRSSEATKYEQAVKEGTIDNLADVVLKGSSGAPKYKSTGTATNVFGVGSVLLLQHAGYNKSTTGSIADIDEVYKSGFIHITGVTDVSGTPADNGTRQSTITFDCYWPKQDR